MDKQCLVCQKTFNAKRATAKFCSTKCRVAFNRVEELDKQEPVKENEWLNSAETKTQAEIEAHYTLANFPPRGKYYSSGGGGSGSLAPYPKTDPRYQAYTV